MGYFRVSVARLTNKYLLNLLKRPPNSLRIPNPNNKNSHPIISNKAIEILRPNPRQRNRRALRKNQTQTPIYRRRDRRSSRPNSCRKDLRRVNPRDHAQSRVEQRKDEEHSNSCAQCILIGPAIAEIDVPRQCALDTHHCTHTQQGGDEQFAPTDSVDKGHEDGVPELRQRAPDANDRERSGGGKAQRLVQPGSVVLDDVHAGALSHGLEAACEEDAVAPLAGEEELAPGADDESLFIGDALVDLVDLVLD